MKKPTKKQILSALASMWNQYCPPPWTHNFMSAGEEAEEVLEAYGLLLKDKTVDWKKLESH